MRKRGAEAAGILLAGGSSRHLEVHLGRRRRTLLAAAGSVMSPMPGITSGDLASRGLPGCMIFPQAGYLAGQSQPTLGCREGEGA